VFTTRRYTNPRLPYLTLPYYYNYNYNYYCSSYYNYKVIFVCVYSTVVQ